MTNNTMLGVCCLCAGYTRLLYRMSMDFLGWARYVPGIQKVWKGVAGQVGHCCVVSPCAWSTACHIMCHQQYTSLQLHD